MEMSPGEDITTYLFLEITIFIDGWWKSHLWALWESLGFLIKLNIYLPNDLAITL
jgi:hypothetical protein